MGAYRTSPRGLAVIPYLAGYIIRPVIRGVAYFGREFSVCIANLITDNYKQLATGLNGIGLKHAVWLTLPAARVVERHTPLSGVGTGRASKWHRTLVL